MDFNILRELNLIQLKNIILHIFFIKFSSEKCSHSTNEQMEEENI